MGAWSSMCSPRWRKFIRELIVQGTHEGLDTAQARVQRLGRPPAATTEQIRQPARSSPSGEYRLLVVARLLGVSRSTIYKYVLEIGEQLAAGETTLDVAEYDERICQELWGWK
ncbi:hypothetical protein [Nocardia asiatica]|uniref:hypothetical protein n=1 Tax=Nocardia asiatica TaxID=209252 RepID=UPI003EE0E57C